MRVFLSLNIIHLSDGSDEMKEVELLSPAGDLERLKITLLYGADSVYVGGKKYNLRANATNFTIEELKEGCSFAHNLGKKVFFTLNIVFHDEDLEELYDYIDQIVKCGVDAFIVSDIAVIKYIKEKYKNIEVHLSTQCSVTNYQEALFYKNLGVDRIVLARELSILEIKQIIDKVGIDIEVFIHGAMCTCLSGRCSLSNYVTNRDANRGGCSQVCRFCFESGDKTFTMATKDLNTATIITKLIEIGVKSFKVEGRMRSIYYLATVIGSYRKIIDSFKNNTLTQEILAEQLKILARVSNRESSTQFLDHVADKSDQYYTGRQEISNQDYLGLIIDYDKTNKIITLKERNYFEKGDRVEIFTPSGKTYPLIIDKIYDEDMNLITVARHPEEIIKLYFEEEIEKYSMLRLIEKKMG